MRNEKFRDKFYMKMVGLSLDAQESCSINVVNSLKVTATSYVLLNLVSNSKFK